MHGILSRRGFLTFAALALYGPLYASANRFTALPAAFARLEKTNGGRLGVAVFDTASGERSGYRVHERFPMCSTFKFLLASAVLQRIDHHSETLDRTIPIPPEPLLSHSPVTELHAGATMTIAALCEAVVTQSDNTAANALLETIGGPPAITQFCRGIGDRVTRLDRTELDLNESLAGDPRDTTSPEAMVGNLQAVLLGNVLSPASRKQITLWMQGCRTGLDRLREKLPEGWHAADKTGANGKHTSNDIAVLWPPGQPPVIVAAYITQCAGPETKRAAMLAEIGRLVANAFNIASMGQTSS
jgi:beta-lactamase class A